MEINFKYNIGQRIYFIYCEEIYTVGCFDIEVRSIHEDIELRYITITYKNHNCLDSRGYPYEILEEALFENYNEAEHICNKLNKK